MANKKQIKHNPNPTKNSPLQPISNTEQTKIMGFILVVILLALTVSLIAIIVLINKSAEPLENVRLNTKELIEEKPLTQIDKNTEPTVISVTVPDSSQPNTNKPKVSITILPN